MTEQGRIPGGAADEREDSPSGVSRRRFLAGAGSAVGGVALAGALSACGSSSSQSAGAASSSGSPKRGGTLTVGSIGSSDDTLDPNKVTSNMDLERLFNLYDNLIYFPHDSLNFQYGVAESIELTKGATVATIRLRHGSRVPQRQDPVGRGPDLHAEADPRAIRSTRRPAQLDQRQDDQEGRRADGPDGPQLRRRDLPAALLCRPDGDPAGRLRPAESGRHGTVQVQELLAGAAQRVRPQPELLGLRAAASRRARDHRHGRPDGADQRAAERSGRRDRLDPAQSDHADQVDLEPEAARGQRRILPADRHARRPGAVEGRPRPPGDAVAGRPQADDRAGATTGTPRSATTCRHRAIPPTRTTCRSARPTSRRRSRC